MQEKDRRIELLRGRRKKSKQQPVSDMKVITNILSDHTELVLEPFFLNFRPASLHYQGIYFQRQMMMPCQFIPTSVKHQKWLVQFYVIACWPLVFLVVK